LRSAGACGAYAELRGLPAGSRRVSFRAMETGVDGGSQHVLCVVGVDLDFDRLAELTERVGGPEVALDYDACQHEPDPRMVKAFEVSADRVAPSFGEEDRAAVAEHRAVAYVVGPLVPAQQAVEASRRMLAVTAALLRAGATAAKAESSGIAHGRRRWLELADAVADATEPAVLAPLLYAAFVRRPLSDGALFYSCGMHLLGEADVELTAADDEVGLEWMDALAGYLLVERGSAGIADGDTFGLGPNSPRRLLHHQPCERYPPDDLMHNPYGYWRLTAA
jgi:hypothetical protein